ncbi:hypothetical protein BAE44_0024808 [Dichanthelium oligosanthes]|uniref:EF-hand domain-containing protein n=1 Tax=Dichanthelium oligosanthes TaxID=888268 RepID=A0A1E5UMR3_9POAL|nr:hypothetical protein BAE44_0024808 [Dichanthelium oligosanthes]
MKLSVPFFGSTGKKEISRRKRSKNGKSGSFGSTTSSSSDEYASVVTTPRTVLPSSTTSASGTKSKPAAVTREDLEVALRRVVSSEEELAEMLAEAEAGLVLEEILATATTDEGELKETFAVFDADGDGRISAEELLSVLASLGDDRCSVEDCRRMIGGVDADGDGFVCFTEFSRMMMQEV